MSTKKSKHEKRDFSLKLSPHETLILVAALISHERVCEGNSKVNMEAILDLRGHIQSELEKFLKDNK